MKFFDLRDKPEHINIVANWFHQEWAHLNPNRSLDDVKTLIASTLKTGTDKIFVGIKDGHPVSSISLREKEVSTSDSFSPWLSSLVVSKKKRKQGLGGETIDFLVRYCRDEGIQTLSLFTEELTAWYQKQGWELNSSATFKGHTGDILEMKLCP